MAGNKPAATPSAELTQAVEAQALTPNKESAGEKIGEWKEKLEGRVISLEGRVDRFRLSANNSVLTEKVAEIKDGLTKVKTGLTTLAEDPDDGGKIEGFANDLKEIFKKIHVAEEVNKRANAMQAKIDEYERLKAAKLEVIRTKIGTLPQPIQDALGELNYEVKDEDSENTEWDKLRKAAYTNIEDQTKFDGAMAAIAKYADDLIVKFEKGAEGLNTAYEIANLWTLKGGARYDKAIENVKVKDAIKDGKLDEGTRDKIIKAYLVDKFTTRSTTNQVPISEEMALEQVESLFAGSGDLASGAVGNKAMDAKAIAVIMNDPDLKKILGVEIEGSADSAKFAVGSTIRPDKIAALSGLITEIGAEKTVHALEEMGFEDGQLAMDLLKASETPKKLAAFGKEHPKIYGEKGLLNEILAYQRAKALAGTAGVDIRIRTNDGPRDAKDRYARVRIVFNSDEPAAAADAVGVQEEGEAYKGAGRAKTETTAERVLAGEQLHEEDAQALLNPDNDVGVEILLRAAKSEDLEPASRVRLYLAAGEVGKAEELLPKVKNQRSRRLLESLVSAEGYEGMKTVEKQDAIDGLMEAYGAVDYDTPPANEVWLSDNQDAALENAAIKLEIAERLLELGDGDEELMGEIVGLLDDESLQGLSGGHFRKENFKEGFKLRNQLIARARKIRLQIKEKELGASKDKSKIVFEMIQLVGDNEYADKYINEDGTYSKEGNGEYNLENVDRLVAAMKENGITYDDIDLGDKEETRKAKGKYIRLMMAAMEQSDGGIDYLKGIDPATFEEVADESLWTGKTENLGKSLSSTRNKFYKLKAKYFEKNGKYKEAIGMLKEASDYKGIMKVLGGKNIKSAERANLMREMLKAHRSGRYAGWLVMDNKELRAAGYKIAIENGMDDVAMEYYLGGSFTVGYTVMTPANPKAKNPLERPVSIDVLEKYLGSATGEGQIGKAVLIMSSRGGRIDGSVKVRMAFLKKYKDQLGERVSENQLRAVLDLATIE